MFRAAVAVLFVSMTAFAQEPKNPAQPLIEAYARFKEQYAAKDYKAALGSAETVIAEARRLQMSQAVSGGLVNKACVLVLLGNSDDALSALSEAIDTGFSDYAALESETDLEPLRADPRFREIVAGLRAKHAPKPLEFDTASDIPEFELKFDPLEIEQYSTLRKEFAIDAVVAGLDDDVEKLTALTVWTSRQWKHSPTGMASNPDPLTILREASRGGRFICRDYALVLAGTARAYGFAARHIALLPKDVETRSEAHSATEVWLPQFNKWVFADGQYGIVPEIDGLPVTAVELQAAIAREDPKLVCRGVESECGAWKAFILRNAYYFKVAADQRRFGTAKGAQLVLVPKGAPNPRKFAGGNEEVFAGSLYTSNPAAMYRKP